MSRPRPPRALEALLERLLARRPHGDAALGDVAEGYARRAEEGGRGAALLWYARQAVSLAVHAGAGGPVPGGRAPAGRAERAARDVREALRGMVRRPGFTAAVVGILGTSVAATVAAFSVASGTFDAARWWADEARTVLVWPGEAFSRGQLQVLRDEQRAFETVGAWVREPAVLAFDGASVTSGGVHVSPELFRALRASPLLGRGLLPEDAAPGAEPVVVLGHGLWTRVMGADPGVVGRVVEVGGLGRRVVGVMPRGAEQPGPGTELWMPLVMDPRDPDFWPRRDLVVAGVVAAGVTVEAAQDDLRRVMGALARRFSFFYPPDFGSDATVVPSAERAWGAVATPLLLLLGGTGLLLLVAAIDVGNLVLARTLERAREMRVRAAVGATRGQVARQVVVEAGLRALLAGALGWGGGVALAGAVSRLFPHGSGVVAADPATPAMAAFVAGLTVLAWALMAAIPAAHVLAAAGRSPRPRGGPSRAAGALVVTQAALATVLLVTAALLVRTVRGLGEIPLGFDPDRVAAVEVAPRGAAYSDAELALLQDALAEAVGAAPGVQAVGWISAVPLVDAPASAPINLEARPVEVAAAPRAAQLVADPRALDVLGLRVVRGRGFSTLDRRGGERVALVNEALARTLWPDGDPVGRRIAVDPHDWQRWITVVGVVEDARWQDLISGPRPAFFLPRDQASSSGLTLVARADGGPAAVAGALGSALERVAPDVPAGEVRALPAVVSDALGATRVLQGLLGILAALATALGALGLYGALAGWVARRRAEIGTRLALGASPRALSWGVVRNGLLLTAAGVAVGSLGGVAAGRAVRGLLYGVSPLDPVSFLVPAALLLATGALAAAVPALRAAAVPPGEALRQG